MGCCGDDDLFDLTGSIYWPFKLVAKRDQIITVPAHFNDAQRRATRAAGAIAGLQVLRILNDPSAAAIAYGFENKDNDRERNVLVFDLGGWTCDVSVVTVKGGSLKVQSTRGGTHLGGDDFTRKMVNHFEKEFMEKIKKPYASTMDDILLQAACEKAKLLLTSLTEAPVSIDHIGFHSSITREEFEEMNEDLFFASLELVRKAIRDAGMTRYDIKNAIVVGGSSRVPKIREMLLTYLELAELDTSLNPDEAVAFGAALQAAIIQGDEADSLKGLHLIDVTPSSFGLNVSGGIMSTVIERHTSIPATKTETFYTLSDDQDTMGHKICEGEHVNFYANRIIGEIDLDGIHPAPVGVPGMEITFTVDEDGILTVSGVQKNAGPGSKLKISYQDSYLTDDEVIQLAKDAERYRQLPLNVSGGKESGDAKLELPSNKRRRTKK